MTQGDHGEAKNKNKEMLSDEFSVAIVHLFQSGCLSLM